MFELAKESLESLGAEITTREIRQQPELWQEALDLYQAREAEIRAFLDKVQETSPDKPVKVIFTGAGTSQYVGDTILPYLKKTGKRGRYSFESVGTTDLVSAPHYHLFADETLLLVSFARSGNSPESVAAVALANQLGDKVFHLTITCAPDGQLAQGAKGDDNNLLLLMPERSNDAGFAMTGSFTCMTLSALLVFDESKDLAEKTALVQEAARLANDVAAREADIQAIVDLDIERIVYLGSGPLAGLTREAQLKVLELTAGQLATMFDSSMGFRHGPKSFVNDKTLVVTFVSNNPYTRDYDLDLAEEVYGDKIARKTLVIAQTGERNFSGDTFGLLSDTLLDDAYLVLPMIFVAQTIALLSSVKVGNTPDTPSATGTVNRVVKGVILHEYK